MGRINYSKLDKFVWKMMYEIGEGEPVSVVELFHAVKQIPLFYKIMGRNYKNIKDRQLLTDYSYTVPILKNSLKRLNQKGEMSDPKPLDRRWRYY